MGSTKQILFDAFAFGTGQMQFKRDQKAKAEKKALALRKKIEVQKIQEEASVLLGQQANAAGATIKGQGGDGSLLTGAGGITDPAITGKQTLLGGV